MKESGKKKIKEKNQILNFNESWPLWYNGRWVPLR